MARDQMYPAKRVRMLAEPVNAQDVRSNILRSMAIMEETISVANTVLEALKPWHNRRVNKRVGDDVAAALKSKYVVHYGKDYFSRPVLKVWSNGDHSYLDHNNEMTLQLVPPDTDPPVFDLDWFAENQAARYITRNVEEIAELSEQLDTLDQRVAQYNTWLPMAKEVISGLEPVHNFVFERGF